MVGEADVIPSLHPVVIELVHEPGNHRDGQEIPKLPSSGHQPGLTREAEDDGVRQQNVPCPGDRRHVGRHYGVSGEQKNLGEDQDGQADPAVKSQGGFFVNAMGYSSGRAYKRSTS